MAEPRCFGAYCSLPATLQPCGIYTCENHDRKHRAAECWCTWPAAKAVLDQLNSDIDEVVTPLIDKWDEIRKGRMRDTILRVTENKYWTLRATDSWALRRYVSEKHPLPDRFCFDLVTTHTQENGSSFVLWFRVADKFYK
jgi:hypothetical protein